MIRRQPPAYSPLSPRALIRSARPPRIDAEQALATTIRERFSVEEVVLCGSGTQALQLAFHAVGQRSGGGNELVALPAFTCYDVASAAIGANVKVVFYDVDPESLAPDLESLGRALQRGLAGVVIAPLYGYQPDWDTLRALTTRHGVPLIEDAAQSFGALWRGRAASGLGDLSILSFGRGKGWTAGEGGALLGSSRELTPLSTSLSSPRSGIGAASRIIFNGFLQWGFGRPTLYAIPSMMPGLSLGETVYHPPVAPRRLHPISARLAMETLEAAEAEANARRARARALLDRLSQRAGASFRVPRPHSESEPGAVRLPVLASPAARRHLLARGRALGIMPSYPRPLPELPPIEAHISGSSAYPGAKALAEGLVTVPTHSLLSARDVNRILALFGDQDV